MSQNRCPDSENFSLPVPESFSLLYHNWHADIEFTANSVFLVYKETAVFTEKGGSAKAKINLRDFLRVDLRLCVAHCSVKLQKMLMF